MKNITLFLAMMAFAITVLAQTPQSFKYQAVVRDNAGNILGNQNVSFRISIHDATAGGTIVYQETFSETTNQFGLVNLNIGLGTPVTGTISNIDWGNNSKFLETEIDQSGGTAYVSMGTSELLSVPYALYAEDDGDWIKDGNNILAANTGNVHIGPSSPFGKFTVTSFGTAVYCSSTSYTGIQGVSSGNQYAGIFGVGGSADSYGVYGFNNFGGDAIRGYSNGGWAGYFTGDLYASGNVGIGTSTPDAKLHVNDRIRIGEDPSYSSVYGELIHEGGGTGFKINASAGGSWAYMLFQTDGNTRMAIKSNGNIGIGTTNPSNPLTVISTGNEYAAIAGEGQNNMGVYGTSDLQYGVYGYSSSDGIGIAGYSANSYAGYFVGDVYVQGSLSKGSGSFVIDHPLDPENKLLRHNFVESPENLLIYRGKIQLDNNGKAKVELPGYFVALTKENEATVTLTCIDTPFLTAYKWENDGFLISGKAGKFVSWVVYADRDDPVIHELGRPVEEEKGPNNKLCDKGKLLYPKAYGFPETMGQDYEMKQMNKR